MNATTETRNDKYSAHKLVLDQDRYEAWVEINVHVQTYGERLTLISLEWTHWSRANADDRARYGAKGEAYWIPGRDAHNYMPATRGHVFARHASGFNSYGVDFESDDTFTACDLLNLASAAWDGMFYPHNIDSTHTNPFRPYDFRD